MFLKKFGRTAAIFIENADPYGFQIHADKLLPELQHALLDGNKLGWKPSVAEPYDLDKQYIEVHPSIGQAVMATLAIACAQASGLDIVGDKRSGELHKCLLEKELDKVYDTWLTLEEISGDSPVQASGEQLMELILGIPSETSNLNKLTLEKLYDLSEERDQINKLMMELRQKGSRDSPYG